MLNLFEKLFDNRYNIVRPKDVYQIGVITPNGSWTGVFGLLKTNVTVVSLNVGSSEP